MKLKKSDHHTIARSLLAFVIVMIAFFILVLFSMNKDAIIDSNNYKTFTILTILGMGFLVILLFLANQPHNPKKKKR